MIPILGRMESNKTNAIGGRFLNGVVENLTSHIA
jgi:hypothetical protein